MPFLGIYSFAQYTYALDQTEVETSTHGNDPAAPTYDAGSPSWVGEDFTFDGGGPTQIDIVDDDGDFEDGYVETGTPQTLASAVTIDGTTYAAGSVVENEFSLIDAGGNEIYVVRIDGVNVGFAYQSGNAPSTNDVFTATSALDGDPADNADGVSASSEPYAGIICFAAGTHIATPGGSRAAEALQVGDLIWTADHGYQPILWRSESCHDLTGEATALRPIRFRAGSLGAQAPTGTLMVSPQHRILIGGPVVSRRYGSKGVLAPARGLLGLPGVRIMRGLRRVRYVHLMLPQHAILAAETAHAESFYPGACAITSLTTASRNNLLRLYPELRRQPAAAAYGPPARTLISCGEAEKLVRAQKRQVMQPDAAPTATLTIAAA